MSQETLALLGGIGFAGFLATLGFFALHAEKAVERDRLKREERGASPTPPPARH